MTSLNVNTGAGSQLSVTAGGMKTGFTEHSTYCTGGTDTNTGGVVSVIVIACVWVLVLPQLSVKVQFW
jgi:hypothetical protein